MVEAGGPGGVARGVRRIRRRARGALGGISRFLDFLHRIWLPARELLRLLWYCRIGVLAVGVCGIALLINDQAQDALTQLALTDVRALGFHATLWLLGLAAWYMSRVRLDLEAGRRQAARQLRRDSGRPSAALRANLLLSVPRALGMAIFLFAAVALLKADGLDDYWSAVKNWELLRAAGALLDGPSRIALIVTLESAAFFAFVYARVNILRELQARGRLPGFMAQAIPAARRDGPPPDTVDALFRSTKIVLIVMLLLSIGLAFLTGFRPVWTAQWFNPLAMAMAGAASIVFFAGAIAYIDDAMSVPLLGTLMVVAMTTTLIANPSDRVTAGPALLGRPTLRVALADWLMAHGHTPQSCRNENYVQPILLVATAGGGSRAGYWTSVVLLHLSADPRFRDALFSISGVSGGSIGAAFFAGLDTAPSSLDDKLKAARGFFSQDFLTPVIGAALFSDLMRRFALVSLGFTNREEAIEQAFAAAWHDTASAAAGVEWDSPFLDLWQRTGGAAAPALFLNGTVVETGQRFIVSNIVLDPVVPHPEISHVPPRVPQFPDGHDGLLQIGGNPGLGRAVSLSYRFPYVLPTAEITRVSKTWGHVVDGGYFENFGATTTLDLLRAIRGSNLPCLHPIVVQISSDPELDAQSIYSAQAPPSAMRWALELRAPIGTLLAARSARGVYAASILSEVVGKRDFFHFGLCTKSGTAPLGFVLSDAAVGVIESTWPEAGQTEERQTEEQKTKDPCGAGGAADSLYQRLKRVSEMAH